MYASGYVTGVSFNFDISGIVELPKIDRLPTITSLPTSITDEENITVKFDNPGGFYIKAFFYRLSGYEFSRQKITSPYTFELTDDERNEIREFMKNKQSDKVATFTIEAYSSSDFSEDSKTGEATKTIEVKIINAKPTVTLNIVETNKKVIDVYGNNTAATVVKNLSQLKISSVVELKKSATLKTKNYTYNGNLTSNAEPITIIPTANKVSVKVTDSRNLTDDESKTLNMVDYLPMVINSFKFFRTTSTSSEIRLTADITYFQATYNKTVNVPVIRYKMGANGTLRTLTDTDYTLDTTNHKITINSLVLLDTLNYKNTETFYLFVNDIFSDDKENDPVLKGVPTFEAGEFDFQINGTLNIANEDRTDIKTIKDYISDKIYPVGSYYETSNTAFDPNADFFGTWELENDGTVLVSKSNKSGSKFNTKLGSTVGAETHTLTAGELPKLSGDGQFKPYDSFSTSGILRGKTWSESKNFSAQAGVQSSNTVYGIEISFGNDEAHNNVQPSKIVNRWHRVS